MVFLEFDSRHTKYTTMITMLHLQVVAMLFQKKLYNDTMTLDNVHFNIVSESDLKEVVKTTVYLTPE